MQDVMDKIELFMIGAKTRMAVQIRTIAERIAKDEEGADTVEIVLGIAIFAVVAILVAKAIGGAIEAKGTEAAGIIESASFK